MAMTPRAKWMAAQITDAFGLGEYDAIKSLQRLLADSLRSLFHGQWSCENIRILSDPLQDDRVWRDRRHRWTRSSK